MTRARPASALGRVLRLATWGVAAACGAAHAAGSDAEVRRMIESLRPAAPSAAPSAAPAAAPARTQPARPQGNGRTRNLVIEAAPAAQPADTPPAGAATAAGNSAAPAAEGAASRPASGLSLAIGFEPNSAQLRPESGETLGALVAAMLSAELRQHRFLIEGHTDASGSPAQNLRLSRERAEQVRLFLVTLGVEGERLRAVGKGSSEPLNVQDPHSAENRRVRVVALP